MTHSDRPVWQSTDRDDRYLFYKGIERVFFSLPFWNVIFPGRTSSWIVNDAVDENTGAYIKSKKEGQTYIPVGGWQYGDGTGTWSDDDTLSVTGNM